jgi:hypothetical protein
MIEDSWRFEKLGRNQRSWGVPAQLANAGKRLSQSLDVIEPIPI